MSRSITIRVVDNGYVLSGHPMMSGAEPLGVARSFSDLVEVLSQYLTVPRQLRDTIDPGERGTAEDDLHKTTHPFWRRPGVPSAPKHYATASMVSADDEMRAENAEAMRASLSEVWKRCTTSVPVEPEPEMAGGIVIPRPGGPGALTGDSLLPLTFHGLPIVWGSDPNDVGVAVGETDTHHVALVVNDAAPVIAEPAEPIEVPARVETFDPTDPLVSTEQLLARAGISSRSVADDDDAPAGEEAIDDDDEDI